MTFQISNLLTYISKLFSSSNDSGTNYKIYNRQNFHCNSNCCNSTNSRVCSICEQQYHKRNLKYICDHCSTSTIKSQPNYVPLSDSMISYSTTPTKSPE